MSTGVEAVSCAVRILRVCHVVFFKQLSCWLLHGTQQDQYNEFFITTRTAESDSDQPSSAVADLSTSDDLDVTAKQLSLIMASRLCRFTFTFLYIVASQSFELCNNCPV